MVKSYVILALALICSAPVHGAAAKVAAADVKYVLAPSSATVTVFDLSKVRIVYDSNYARQVAHLLNQGFAKYGLRLPTIPMTKKSTEDFNNWRLPYFISVGVEIGITSKDGMLNFGQVQTKYPGKLTNEKLEEYKEFISLKALQDFLLSQYNAQFSTSKIKS